MGMYLTYSVPELKERGWTAAAIRRFLGEPDEIRPNPYYRRAGAPMRLYRMDRVEQVEASKDFSEWRGRSAARSARARGVAERKRQELLNEVATWEPALRVPTGDVVRLARQSYEDHQKQRGRWDKTADGNNAEFLERIVHNFLRHQCSDYEEKLASIRGRIGVHEAYEEIKSAVTRKIDQAIAKCMRRLLLERER